MIFHFVSYLVTYFLPISSQFYGSICYWINCVKLELAPTNCFCFNCRSIELEPKLLDAYWHRHLLYLLQDNKKVLSIERQAVSVLCCPRNVHIIHLRLSVNIVCLQNRQISYI